MPPNRQQMPGSTHGSTGMFAPTSAQSQGPLQRRPLFGLSGNHLNRPSVSGYGMSAGIKIGRQQGGHI
jgi:hypothetical protein